MGADPPETPTCSGASPSIGEDEPDIASAEPEEPCAEPPPAPSPKEPPEDVPPDALDAEPPPDEFTTESEPSEFDGSGTEPPEKLEESSDDALAPALITGVSPPYELSA